jgi:tripartite-type tricarboxylate transporter receptor subunit TctC
MKTFYKLTLAALLLACSALSASAQGYPNKPIRVIVPYPAGGTTDQLARAIQQPMSESLGQPIVIDNKPGAGGTIGTEQTVRAAPDGYTLVFGNTGPNAVVSLMRKINYDVQSDLRPIATVAITPMILAVPTDSPATNMKEFLAYARREDGKLNYGSVGNGSLSHLSGEFFKDAAGLKMQHIPYAGGAPLLTALVGGQLQAAFVTGLDGASMLATGKVRYLAVATTARTPVVPDLPAIAEDVPGFKSSSWFGLLAPKGTPDEVIGRLNAAVKAALARPEIRKMFSDRRIEVGSGGPEDLEKLIRDELKLWGPVVQKANIQM